MARVSPGPNFEHLHRLTDATGLFEHALHDRPRPEHGYCVDDAARALVVVCRAADSGRRLQLLGRQYLDFTLAAISSRGAVHNRMNSGGRWTDEPDVGDCWGRALWGLGTAAVHAPTASMRAEALLGFRAAARKRSPHRMASAFATIGAAEVLLRRPEEAPARDLLADCISALGPDGTAADWPWPEPRLRYGNGSLVEALLLAGQVLPDPDVGRRGLHLLEFLLGIETRGGRLSVTPVGGRGPGDPVPAFDQQPIEVSALADAAARAFDLTGDDRWRDAVGTCWAWFLGENDSGVEMYDPATGGGYDGLRLDGRNLNQGAESTLAALSTGLHAVRLGLF